MHFEDHLTAPRGLGALAGWPHAGAAGGAACGDLVRVAVRVEGDLSLIHISEPTRRGQVVLEIHRAQTDR